MGAEVSTKVKTATLANDESVVVKDYDEEKGRDVQNKTQLNDLEDNLQTLRLEANKTAPSEGTHVEKGVQTDKEDDSFCSTGIVRTSRSTTPYTLYSPHILDSWFITLVKSSFGSYKVWMYNAGLQYRDMISTIIETKVGQLLNSSEKMYYHGTDACSVRNILEHGIDLAKSERSMDFSSGGGFYLTENLQQAVDWSERVARWTRNRGAVIGFKVRADLQQEQPHLSLNANNITDMILWQCIVSHFRQGRRSPDVTKVLKDMKFISGPVAMNAYLGPEEIPSPKLGFTQMCICDGDYAKRFGSLQNISFVLFLI